MKNKRLKGESYKNVHGVDQSQRLIGPSCDSNYCKNSKYRHCQSIDEKARKGMNEKFCSMNSWQERKIYVKTLVLKGRKIKYKLQN